MSKRASEEIKQDLESLKSHLIQQKDEIKVQIELAKMEAKDEWKKVEHQWGDFLHKMKSALDSAEDLTEEAVEAVESIGKDLKHRLKRIVDRFDD